MSYEYNVPFVDFTASYGNDEADKFFDDVGKLSLRQTSQQETTPEDGNEYLENQPPKHTPGREEKRIEAGNERSTQKEISDNSLGTRSAVCDRRVLRNIQMARGCKTVEAQKVNHNLKAESMVKKLTVQVSQGASKPVSTAKSTKHIETIENVNGELCIKTEEMKHTGVPRNIPNQSTKTILHSQRFEERQKLSKQRRDDMIKKVLEEEQKKREFHANPLPNYMKLTKQKTTASVNPISSSLENTNTFHAQPASVVHKQPFIPKRTERSEIKPGNVMLHSDKRAKERKEFDEKLKQHKKEQEDALQARKEELLRQEKEEIAELRKRLVFKAQPVSKCKGASSSAVSDISKGSKN